MNKLLEHPFLTILLAAMLITQACWIYKDAKKRGEKYYFLWGLFGLLNIPSNLIIYLIVTRIIFEKMKKNK